MTTVEVLLKARALYGANPSHAPVGEIPRRDTHCPITAMAEATLSSPADYVPAEEALVRTIGTIEIPRWNAEHSTEEVLAAFDRAIEAAA